MLLLAASLMNILMVEILLHSDKKVQECDATKVS